MPAFAEARYIGLPDGNRVDIIIRTNPKTELEYSIAGTFPPQHTGMLPERAYVVADEHNNIIGRVLGIKPMLSTETNKLEWEIPLGVVARLCR